MEYTIESQELTLTASALGAGLQSLSTRQGLPLLRDGTQVCFPWCGSIEGGWYENRGFQYREADMPCGFVRDKKHLPAGQEPGKLAFRLEWPGSLGLWPWAFELETVHALEGNRAVSTCTVENRSGRPMPVQFGFQIGLCCPFLPGTEMGDYQVRFEGGRVVPLTQELFTPDGLHFADVGAWARLEHRETGKYLEVEALGYPNVVLRSESGVLHVGLWTGSGGGGHELAERPGSVLMEHGEKRSWRQMITVCL
ncbi:MAG: hypothetical protein VB096_04570 [Pseudoflavonifractor sp.]|nr:hypothetical protein [Pseudoflavonifractor sp.]